MHLCDVGQFLCPYEFRLFDFPPLDISYNLNNSGAFHPCSFVFVHIDYCSLCLYGVMFPAGF
jgi:hypothetical protein